MRDTTRYSLSSLLSLLAHGLFVIVFVLATRVRIEPEPEVLTNEDLLEIDFIEFDKKEILPDAAQGEPEPPKPEPEPPAPEEQAPPPTPLPEDPNSKIEAPKPPEPEPEAKPKPKFGDKRSKITALVPENATWTLMLANTRIKKLPFRDSATELMAPLRDFQLLVDDAGFNVWEDFEFIVMGSPDATDQTQAFVAVQYKFGHQEMRAGIDRAAAKSEMAVDWREEGGAWIGDPRMLDPEKEEFDDRQFVLLPGDEVALYLREEFIPQVITGPDAGKGKTSGNFVANIAKMKRFTRDEPKAGLQLVLQDLRNIVKLPKGSPIDVPDRIEVMWEAAKSPELLVKIDFIDEKHADKAEAYWKNNLEADLRQTGAWTVVGGIIAGTTLERDGKQIRLRHEFNETAARVVLQLMAREFGKAMRYSEKQAKAAKEARDKLWEARQGGKLLPSQVLDGEKQPEPEPTPAQPTEPDEPTPAEPEAQPDEGKMPPKDGGSETLPSVEDETTETND